MTIFSPRDFILTNWVVVTCLISFPNRRLTINYSTTKQRRGEDRAAFVLSPARALHSPLSGVWLALSGQFGNQFEHRQVHRNHDAADGDAEECDDDGLEQGQHV